MDHCRCGSHKKGTVSFKVRVTEDAVEEDTISNTASVKVGNDDPTTSNKVENNFPKKEDITQPAVTEIHVGDELTYQISFPQQRSRYGGKLWIPWHRVWSM